MDKILLEKIAMYLTYEFSMHFNPNSIRSLSAFKEVKLWPCKEQGLPVFSHGSYHGQVCNEAGMVSIDSLSIHIRLSKSDSEALLHSQAKGDPVYCREVEAGILRKVHRQIKLQLPTVGDAFLTDAIKAMVEEKKTYIDAIRKLIKDEENDRYAH